MANEEPAANGATLEAAVDEAVAACGGDPRAAVRALLVTLDATEREIAALKAEVVRIEATVSGGPMSGGPVRGTVRGRLRRQDRP